MARPPAVRRHVVKGRPPVKVARAAKLEGVVHAHRCITCRYRYEDRCDDPHGDAVCSCCRYNTTWPGWRTNRLPQPCCKMSSRIATADEKTAHRLGGESTWYLCESCKRTHPYDPAEGDTP